MDCEWEPGESFGGYLIISLVTLSIMALLFYYVSNCVANRQCATNVAVPNDYTYEGPCGVDEWSEKYPASVSCRQSPVNLSIMDTTRVAAPADLNCSGFNEPPLRLQLHNEGHTAWMLGRWCNGLEPVVSGGPLCSRYKFHSLCFRWGPGAEHCINENRAALEVQAMFLREDIHDLTDASAFGRKDSLLVISYVYEVTPFPNPFLNHVIHGLGHIIQPQTYVDLDLRPLCWLAPAFARDYFCYRGSLTFPPCSEVAVWLLQPEPLGIGPDQLAKFRRLRNNSGGEMLINSRPLQQLNDREVLFYN